jgi:hypothetical protein
MTPVQVRGEPLHEIWWRGRQWVVTAYGVEALDGSYHFEAKRLAEELKDTHPYGWPAHMSGKTWVDLDDFATAWLVAFTLHGVRADAKDIHAAIARMAPSRTENSHD